MASAAEEQRMVDSEPSEPSPIAQRKPSIQKPEDILDRLGARHRRLVIAIVSCSFVWVRSHPIDCGNCTDAMITVVSEFDLRGDRLYLAEWSTSFFMAFGRRPLLLICLAFQAFFTLLASMCSSVHLFSICRLLQGACYTGANLVAWVTAYEHTHPDLRSFTTFLFGATWVLGYSVVALLAYISATWREMMIWGAGSTFIFTLWCWRFVPETLHFLVSRRRAKSIHEWLSGVHYSSAHQTDIAALLQHPVDNSSSEKSSFFHELWIHKIFILYCFVQLYMWTCDNFVYFGLSLYSTQLAGNPYTNYLLMGLVELPAYIAGPILLE
ncbi:hypothetical protein OSTOST_12126, partial [Ostertagia ostertagi]